MLFTIMEILGYLVATALLSGYLGWLIHEKAVIKDVQKRVSTEVNSLRSRCSKLMDELDTVRAELAASEQARAELEANVPALMAGPAEAVETAAAAQARTIEVEAHEVAEAAPLEPVPLAPAPQPPAGASEPTHPDDDLKVIKGIGPVLERKLKGMGITSYGQVATLTPEDITRLGRSLGIGDRINRDNWVGRARDAYIKTYGAEP